MVPRFEEEISRWTLYSFFVFFIFHFTRNRTCVQVYTNRRESDLSGATPLKVALHTVMRACVRMLLWVFYKYSWLSRGQNHRHSHKSVLFTPVLGKLQHPLYSVNQRVDAASSRWCSALRRRIRVQCCSTCWPPSLAAWRHSLAKHGLPPTFSPGIHSTPLSLFTPPHH